MSGLEIGYIALNVAGSERTGTIGSLGHNIRRPCRRQVITVKRLHATTRQGHQHQTVPHVVHNARAVINGSLEWSPLIDGAVGIFEDEQFVLHRNEHILVHDNGLAHGLGCNVRLPNQLTRSIAKTPHCKVTV